MTADLTLALVKRLRFDQKPVAVDAKGGMVFEPNDEPYIVWDSNRDAPPGFCVRVSAKETDVIRCEVRGVSVMPNVGSVADFLTLDIARKRAAEFDVMMIETARNPNQDRRDESAAETTLGNALAAYRNQLATRVIKRGSPKLCGRQTGT